MSVEQCAVGRLKLWNVAGDLFAARSKSELSALVRSHRGIGQSEYRELVSKPSCDVRVFNDNEDFCGMASEFMSKPGLVAEDRS